MQTRGSERCPEHGRLNGPGEEHRTTAHANAFAFFWGSEHQEPTAATERLCERRGNDHAIRERHVGEEAPSPVPALPAHSVRVVDVETHIGRDGQEMTEERK